jgi:hypothetical protein
LIAQVPRESTEGSDSGYPQLDPGLSQLNPDLSQINPDLSQLNPNLSQLHLNLSQLHPDLSQLNPNSTPDLSQLNPKIYPGPVTTEPEHRSSGEANPSALSVGYKPFLKDIGKLLERNHAGSSEQQGRKNSQGKEVSWILREFDLVDVLITQMETMRPAERSFSSDLHIKFPCFK